MDAPRRLAVPRLPEMGWDGWHPAVWQELDEAPWAERFPDRPEVAFSMAWNDRGAALSWRVREREVRAACRGFNGRVWEDSCVEFFWAPGTEGFRHYAFEANPAGALLGCVCDAPDRVSYLSPDALAEAVLRPLCLDAERWTLDAFLPAALFGDDWGEWRSGGALRANFYKCGDRLAAPHYLCWNRVVWPEPSFHRPEGFGLLVLG